MKGILLAEDDYQIRNLLEEILKAEGFYVYTAVDGEEALKIFNENNKNIDLLMLDLGLPKMTGVEVYRTIRNIRPDIKVLAMSGWGQNETTSVLYQDGVEMFLQKPYKPGEVLKAVRNIFGDENDS